MDYKSTTFSEFIDKDSFFKLALTHTELVGNEYNNNTVKNKETSVFLWATEHENKNYEFKAITNRDAAKNILLSSSSKANDGIKRLYDQIIFECDRKFGGTSELAVMLSKNITKNFTIKHEGKFDSDKVNRWAKMLFEEIIPIHLANKALPNNAETFAKAMQVLYEHYDEDLLEATIKAAITAGSGGNIIVQQSPYYGRFSINKGISGYHFSTFEKSKMFIGLNRFSDKKAIKFSNPKILLVNGAVEDFSEIEEILDTAAQTKQPIVIIADRVSDEIFDVFKLNFDKGVVDCFAIESNKDFRSVNTVTDVGVIANVAPITPFTMYSEFLLAKWETLPTIDEIIINKDGKVTINNNGTEIAVRNHIKKIAEKRQALTEEEFSVKEPNYTARIKNLTTSPTILYVPYKTEIEGETKRIKIDTLLRYLKSVISYGVLDLSKEDFELAITKLSQKIDSKEKQQFEKHKWLFVDLFEDVNGLVPYLHIVGARRFILNNIAQIFGIGGMIITTE